LSDLHLALRLREEYTNADPFAPDVWWMGNLIQRNLIEVRVKDSEQDDIHSDPRDIQGSVFCSRWLMKCAARSQIAVRQSGLP
jgi:hypothetical protein